MATITFTAKIIKEPLRQEFKNGKKKLSLRLAENFGHYDEAGTWQQTGTIFHNVELWDKDAEKAAGKLNILDLVQVTGEQITRTYEKDGQKGAYTYIHKASVALSLNSVQTSTNQPDQETGNPASEPQEPMQLTNGSTDIPGWAQAVEEQWGTSGG